MSTHGKRYTAARAKIDRENLYSPVEAIKILKEFEGAKFDETVEVHFRLGLNVRHADEQLRGTLMLPHGTGRTMRVAVFAEGDKAREAEEAGADIVGSADLAAKIEGGFVDFDVAIATPDQMGNVGKLGRVLGPRGLMPNPKTGTVTFDVGKAVSDAKAGKLDTAPTGAPTCTSRSGRRASPSERWSRTTPRSSTRSCGRSPPPRRGATSRESRSPPPWAPACTSTRRARAGSSRSSRRPQPSSGEASARLDRIPTRPSPKTAGSPANEGRSPAEVDLEELLAHPSGG